MTGRAILAAVLAAAAALAPGAARGEDAVLHPPPRGPALGNNSWRGEIRDDGAADRDLFAAPLVAGEAISIEVRAGADPDGGPGLLPRLALLDPRGVERPIATSATPDGTAVRLRRFEADLSGRWAVVVSGAEGSEGPYRVRSRVRPGGVRGRALLRAEGPAGGIAGAAVEAIRGAVLDLDLRAAGDGRLPPFFEILDPHGGPVPLAAALLRRRDGAWRLHGLSLDGPDGAWRVLVGVGAGERAALRWRVRPPWRPRGDGALAAYEPALAPRTAPLPVGPGGLVRVEGEGFCPHPAPAVLLDGRPVGVLGADPGGRHLDVLLPARPGGATGALAVVNPDGQACEEPAYLLWSDPGPVRLLDLVPGEIRLPAGGRAEVRARLSGLAPPTGAEVVLRVTGGVGSVPATAFVPPYRTEVAFAFEAGAAGGAGTIEATLGVTERAAVRVDPPPPPGEIDLSGWRLDQTDSARTHAFPAGTVLRAGGRLVVARDCSRDAFEKFWGRALGSEVLFVDSDDQFPSFNGAETVALRDNAGQERDGPTVVLSVGNGYRRLPGDGPANLASSWAIGPAAPGVFAPADGPIPAAAGVRITAFADPTGTGNFVYEFVEISFPE